MDKEKTYELLVKQVESMIEGENNPAGQLANAAALMHETMQWWWTGFYQGPVACYRIKRGKGVCGTAWHENRTVVVDDVEQFPGHIACSSESRSEIVVPLHDSQGGVVGVIDIDSKDLATFDEVDARWLEEIARVIERHVKL